MAETLTIPALVAGLPPGPATEASVRGMLKVWDTLDDDAMALAINATNSRVLDIRLVDKFVKSIDPEADDNDWTPRIVLGATLLACRLFARRNSPEGVATFIDQGAVYVQRNDPDVADLLGLGKMQGPALG